MGVCRHRQEKKNIINRASKGCVWRVASAPMRHRRSNPDERGPPTPAHSLGSRTRRHARPSNLAHCNTLSAINQRLIVVGLPPRRLHTVQLCAGETRSPLPMLPRPFWHSFDLGRWGQEPFWTTKSRCGGTHKKKADGVVQSWVRTRTHGWKRWCRGSRLTTSLRRSPCVSVLEFLRSFPRPESNKHERARGMMIGVGGGVSSSQTQQSDLSVVVASFPFPRWSHCWGRDATDRSSPFFPPSFDDHGGRGVLEVCFK